MNGLISSLDMKAGKTDMGELMGNKFLFDCFIKSDQLLQVGRWCIYFHINADISILTFGTHRYATQGKLSPWFETICIQNASTIVSMQSCNRVFFYFMSLPESHKTSRMSIHVIPTASVLRFVKFNLIFLASN